MINPAWLLTISRQFMTTIIYMEALASEDWVIALITQVIKPAVQIQYHSGYMWDIMTRHGFDAKSPGHMLFKLSAGFAEIWHIND